MMLNKFLADQSAQLLPGISLIMYMTVTNCNSLYQYLIVFVESVRDNLNSSLINYMILTGYISLYLIVYHCISR